MSVNFGKRSYACQEIGDAWGGPRSPFSEMTEAVRLEEISASWKAHRGPPHFLEDRAVAFLNI
jgi:hypothetical protein